MRLRFYRRLKILPGLTLNLSRRGASASIGGRGAHVTLRPGHAPRATVGLPGTGLALTEGGQAIHHQAHQEAAGAAPEEPAPMLAAPAPASRGWLWLALILVFVVALRALTS